MPDGNIQLTVTLTPQDVKAKAVSLRNEIQKIFDTTSADGLTKSMQNIMSTMDGLNTKAQAVHKTLHEMETTKVVNPRIKELTDQITTAGRELNNLLDTRKKLTDEGETPKGGWKKFNQGVDEALQRVTRLSLERSDIYKSGQEFVTQAQADPAKYEAQKVALAGLNDAMAVNIARFQDEQYAITKVSEDESLWVRATDQAAASTDRFNQSIGNTGGAIANARRHTNKFTSALKGKLVGALERVKAGFQKAFSVKGMLSGLKTLVKYTLGVSSLLYAFKKLVNMAKEGLHNLVQYKSKTNETNKQMTNLQTSLLYVKNAWAAAFAPVLNTVLPILADLLDMFAQLGNRVARFVAALTGQSTAIQAVRVSTQDYATSVGKAAKNQEKLNKRLAAFDDLNVLGKDSDTSGAGDSNGAPDPNDMFTTVDIDPSKFGDVFDWLDKLKQKVADSGIIDALGRIKDAFDRFKNSPFVTTMQEILKILGNNILTSSLGFISDTLGLIANILDGEFLGSLGSLKDIIADLTFDPLIMLGDTLDTLLGTDGIGDWFREVKQAIKDIDIKELPGWEKFEKALDKVKENWNKLKTALQEGWKTLKDEGVLDEVKKAITWLTEQGIDVILQGCATALNLVAIALQTIADIINGDFDLALEDIRQFIATLSFDPLITVAGVIDSIFNTDIAGWLQGIKDVIGTGTVDEIEGLIDSANLLIETLAMDFNSGNLYSILYWLEGFLEKGPVKKLDELQQSFNEWVTGTFSQEDLKKWRDFGTVMQTIGQYLLEGAFTGGILPAINTIKGYFNDPAFKQEVDNNPIVKTIKGIGDTLSKAYDWEHLKSTFDPNNPNSVLGKIKSAFSGSNFTSLATDVSTGWSKITDVFSGTWSKIGGYFAVSNPNSIWAKLKGKFTSEYIKTNFVDKVKSGWDVITGVFSGTWGKIKKYFEQSNKDSIWAHIREKFTSDYIKTNVVNKMKGGWDAITEVFSGTWGKIKKYFDASSNDSIIKKIQLAFLGTWGKVNGEQTYIGGFVGGILDALRKLKTELKKPFQAIIDFFYKNFINKIVDAINWLQGKLTFTIGGKSYTIGGLNPISYPTIPKLAQGAVIPPNREFLAVLGDQSRGTNIEAPLDTIKQAVAEVVGGNNASEVVRLLNELLIELRRKELKVGDKEIGKANERYQANQRIIRGTAI